MVAEDCCARAVACIYCVEYVPSCSCSHDELIVRGLIIMCDRNYLIVILLVLIYWTEEIACLSPQSISFTRIA